MTFDLRRMQQDVHEIAQRLSEQLPDENLRAVFKKCFVNTADTTVQLTDDLPFVITGDIPAMWLRDSASQVTHYLPFLGESEQLRLLVRSMVIRQARYVVNDPYVNAFNECANGRKGDEGDVTVDNPLAWERKYEVDSLCSMLHLTNAYYQATGDKTVFDDTVKQAFESILAVWKIEQHHMECSAYRFERFDCPPTDTLTHEGCGAPVSYTGMTWSGFRPSDDACVYGYLVPANMYAVVTLRQMAALCREIYGEEALAMRAELLALEIDKGIQTYGIVEHPQFGKIYAYETDGRGNYLLMDDANVPSLLSIPLLGYRPADDEIYQNTRRFALSGHNPYYFEGPCLRGIGSPHTEHNCTWPISLCVQALTSGDEHEVDALLEMLTRSTAGTEYMHESVCVYDDTKFSRSWFAWANSLFAHTVCQTRIKIKE